MRLYLIRHVKTVDNEKGSYCGQTETAISEEGYLQLERLAKLSDLQDVSRVFASPMQRTIQTAASFCKEVTVIEELKEISFGRMEGMTFEEVRRQLPLEYDKMLSQGDAYQYPDGESLTIFCERVRRGLEILWQKTKGEESVFVVAHAGTIRAILSLLLCGSSELYWRFRVDNASVSVVDVQDGFAVLQQLNRTI